MTQINWQLTPDQVAGYVVTATNWNDVVGDLRAFIDQTTSSASDNTPLPIGIDLVNDRVYISDPDTTTPEDGNHADTTLSVVGTTTLDGNTQQTGTFTVGVDDTGFDVQFFGATAGKSWLWDEDADKMIVTGTTTLAGDVLVSGADLTVGGGDISLGTTAAGETLNIAGVTTASGAGSNLKVKGGDATGTNQSGAWLILQSGLGTGSGASGDILFYTGPAGGSGTSQNTATKVMTCKSDGDVTMENSLGIGTGSPDRALEVEGAFGGYGIHIDSSTGAGIEIDRGASTNSHGVLFQTAGVDNWYIGNYNDGDALVIKDGKWDGTEIAAFTPTGLGVGTVAPGWSVDVEAAAQARIRVQGGGTGYTQANILLESSTTDTPEDRGLGIYYWNRGDDQTWFTGRPYATSVDVDRWCINRVPATGFQEAAATAASSYTLVTVDTTGMVIGGRDATAPLEISDFSGYISTPALRFTHTTTTVSAAETIGKIEFYNSDSGGAGVNAQISAYAFDNAGATALEFEVGDNDTLITPLMLKPEGGNHASVPMLADFGGYSTVYIGWRLGIGTVAPAYKLDVDGDINYTAGNSIYYDTADAANSVAFRIDAGNRDVSIFRVSTDTWSTDSDYGATLKYMGTRTGNNNSLSIFMDNQTGTQVEAMTILQDGNVGIGTSSPAAQLQISNTGAGQLYATSSGFYIDQSASQLDGLFLRSQGHVVISSDLDGGTANDYIAFTTNNGGERMRVDTTGVGIGTTSPAVPLDVAGSIRTSGQLIVQGTNASAIAITQTDTLGGYITFNATNGTTRIGYIGYPSNDDLHLKNETAGGRIYLSTNNATRMTVQTDGDVDTTGRWGIDGTHHNSYALIIRTSAPTYMTGETYEAGTYNNTTVGGNETRITASGRKFRFTSSGRYKTDVEDVIDSYADEVLNLRPVWYRSLCRDDRSDWSHWGLIAEEVAEIDPRLAQYQHVPIYNEDGSPRFSEAHATDEDGNPIIEQGEPMFEVDDNGDHVLQIEGVNYNSIVPLLINLIKRQDARIAALEAA